MDRSDNQFRATAVDPIAPGAKYDIATNELLGITIELQDKVARLARTLGQDDFGDNEEQPEKCPNPFTVSDRIEMITGELYRVSTILGMLIERSSECFGTHKAFKL